MSSLRNQNAEEKKIFVYPDKQEHEILNRNGASMCNSSETKKDWPAEPVFSNTKLEIPLVFVKETDGRVFKSFYLSLPERI